MSTKFIKQLSTENSIHNLIWFTLDHGLELKSFTHVPEYNVSSSTRKLHEVLSSFEDQRKSELKSVAFDIIQSGTMLESFKELCQSATPTCSNGVVICLIYIGMTLAEEMMKQHKMSEIKQIIFVLQMTVKNMCSNESFKVISFSSLNFVVLLILTIYSLINQFF